MNIFVKIQIKVSFHTYVPLKPKKESRWLNLKLFKLKSEFETFPEYKICLKEGELLNIHINIYIFKSVSLDLIEYSCWFNIPSPAVVERKTLDF